jgi:hypothetical protein
VERRWDRPQPIRRVVLWWGAAGTWPERYAVEYWQDGWRRFPGHEAWVAAGRQREEVQLPAPLTTGRLRIIQDAGGGGRDLPDALCIQELSAYAGDEGPNLCRAGTAGFPMDLRPLNKVLDPPSVVLDGPPGLRAVVRRTHAGELLLHLYNLNVTRQDSYHDRVEPVQNLRVGWCLPPGEAARDRLRLLSPDEGATTGSLACTATQLNGRVRLEFVIPKLTIWTIAGR